MEIASSRNQISVRNLLRRNLRLFLSQFGCSSPPNERQLNDVHMKREHVDSSLSRMLYSAATRGKRETVTTDPGRRRLAQQLYVHALRSCAFVIRTDGLHCLSELLVPLKRGTVSYASSTLTKCAKLIVDVAVFVADPNMTTINNEATLRTKNSQVNGLR